MPNQKIHFLLLMIWVSLLSACHFHWQGEVHLAKPLQRLYLQTDDPYGYLARHLQQYLKMSHVELVNSPEAASATLVILKDIESKSLLGVSGTQQTRQYNLVTTVTFSIVNHRGITIVSPQTLTESRAITIQSNQILGSSNEATLFYQQMHRSLAYAIMNRLASNDISRLVTQQQR